MKNFKILAALFVTLCLVVACNKDRHTDFTAPEQAEQLALDDDTQIEYDVFGGEDDELTERAASLSSVASANLVASSESCVNTKHVGFNVIPVGAATTWTITGSELGATKNITALKGSATANGFVKAIVYQSSPATSAYNKAKTDTVTCTTSAWSATSITASLPAINFDSLRTFSIKFIVGYPVQAKDSSVVSVKTKSKTVKCIGSLISKRYGTFEWDVLQLHKKGNAGSDKDKLNLAAFAGNNSLTAYPTYGAAANLVTDSTNLTMLQAGDIVETANGAKGVVFGVTARDPKKGYKVRIYARECANSSLKKSTLTMVQTKGLANSARTYTKFARKQ
jgi:hypothetical protein